MVRNERFTFVVNPAERALIDALAERLHRSRSDAVRFIVIQVARALQDKLISSMDIEPLVQPKVLEKVLEKL